jgi:acetyl-CoA carboxylase carboxyltransferase component
MARKPRQLAAAKSGRSPSVEGQVFAVAAYSTQIADLRSHCSELFSTVATLQSGGGSEAIARQHAKKRLTARERLDRLFDAGAARMELGLWAGYRMYDQWGGAPAAGVVTVIGRVADRTLMVIANDATVKAGAFFPQTVKKVLRAQRIALENRLPLIYLVDSAGVFLPLQDEIFPDEDDFGRIFRNNAVISAAGVPQLAAIMGNCVAGGGYLPVLCDKLLMTDGSGLYLAGPALVKAAIGQEVSHEELGGALMHSATSGTVDYREPNDEACIERLRRLVANLPPDSTAAVFTPQAAAGPARPPAEIYDIFPVEPTKQYDIHAVLDTILDAGSFDEYKAEFGKTIVCGTARLGGFRVGVVANQHKNMKPADGPIQFGGVIYVDSADKAARFVMDCNQLRLPILFFQDVNGFMVGRDSERQGIIRAGAKLVNVISNSVVPKITVILGGSYGAGNYALCGKAFDPRFIFAWPTARYAVMGGHQAASTLLDITVAAMRREGKDPDADELDSLRRQVAGSYDEQTDIRYAAARGWVDAIINPAATRDVVRHSLEIVTRHDESRTFQTGVLQV